jgi:hypothetical protein
MASKKQKKKDTTNKPIMSVDTHTIYSTYSLAEQFAFLERLFENEEKKERMGRWLENVKVEEDIGEPYIENPLLGYPYIKGDGLYINREVSYQTLYKWCVLHYKDLTFAKLPKPIDEIIDDEANRWKRNPSEDPYTHNAVRVSLVSNSEYVILYKKIMNKLVSNILKAKTAKTAKTDMILTVEECYQVKYSLPSDHAHILSSPPLYYDYLFIVYFVNSKTIQYDPEFKNELTIYLDSAVYTTSTFDGKASDIENPYTFLFLKNYITRMSESPLSVISIVMKLSAEIKNMMLSKTSIDIDRVKFNMNVLEYCKRVLYKSPYPIIQGYLKEYEKNKGIEVRTSPTATEATTIPSIRYRTSPTATEATAMPNARIRTRNTETIRRSYLAYSSVAVVRKDDMYLFEQSIKKLLLSELEKDGYSEYIYEMIVAYIKNKDSDAFETSLSIYNSILKLYMDNKNHRRVVYKYIRDPYKGIGIEPPQMPKRPQMTNELQRYKIRKERNDKERNDGLEELQKYYINDKKTIEEYDIELMEYNKRLKEYELKKEIYDRIYDGTYSPKKPLLTLNVYKRFLKDEREELELPYDSIRKTKSEDVRISAIPAIPSFAYYSDKVFSDKIHHIPNDYYKNDIDPYTQEEFRKMNPKKQKYVSDIVYNIGERDIHYRFDTVSVYNYILKCIDNCNKPINFFNRTELTDANLKEICDKIKYFTKMPTYSSTEIKALLKDCVKYDNRLVFDYDIEGYPKQKGKDLVGVRNVYLNIKLGNLLFRVSDSGANGANVDSEANVVLSLPHFNRYKFPMENSVPKDIFKILQTKLSEGALIGSKYFPYRKNNTILMLPKFEFDLNDDAPKTLERLKAYKQEILQI